MLAREAQRGFPCARIDGLIIIIVMPRSRMVAEMKLHAWAEVHGYARAMMASPIANVVLVNVTTVV